MFFNDNAEYELVLEKFAYGGEAMGRLDDGRAVFVPFGLPGERVRVRLTEEKKNFARGEIVEILEPSPDRIKAKCKHFGECGGCHYQNLSYEKQLQAKTDILIDQLQRIGKVEDPPVKPMVACPSPWNYRNHVQFSLDENSRLGFQAPHSNRVIPITECHLPESAIDEFWHQLAFEPGTHIERVSLRAGADEDLMLVLESDFPEAPELAIEAGISVAHIYEENTVVLAGNDHIILRVLDRDFKVSAASFFQVNTVMAGKMVEHLVARLPITRSTTLLDVYCGVGLFSAFLAPNCGRVIGIESSESACEDFAVNLDEFDNVELYEGAAEAVIPHLEANPDIVLVDPPRAGLDKAVVDGILRLNPNLIAYVSCDPSTLARDAARLIRGGYKPGEITPFDLFPQTYHIESISFFER
ncbi:MAG: 23S rRNA (uracil(1939)-C(5))-methyltransferase RlmD [Anaerolineales bacterium]|nr:class I SAM-dependent RNA methyltransferase [Anaerolineae bacterium]PWB69734.1 MAG: 23S rRNA (uracil(1939)-C(5))-methyltransferase RlmD [Anaerolineales bacterium]